MEASNISMNEEESLNENTYKKNWRKIRNKYIYITTNICTFKSKNMF